MHTRSENYLNPEHLLFLMKRTSTSQALNSQKIIKELEKQKIKLKQLGVKKIGLFGSYLHRKAHKKSDLDFLVSFKDIHFDEYMELKFFLEEHFHTKVDLVLEEELKPALQFVKKEARYAKGF